MNPRKRIERAWNGMEEKADSLKEAATGPAKDRLDTELGIYLHKNIGTLFYFDKQVRRYEKEIAEAARNGEKQLAIQKSVQMKSYILFEMKHNRRYKKKMKEVAGKLEDREERFREKVESLSGSRLLSYLESLNGKDVDAYVEEVEGDV